MDSLDYTYCPGGRTALFDAQMKAIEHIEERITKLPDAEKPSKIIFATITDGLDNDSVLYSADDVKLKIQILSLTDRWEFMYLGANQDAFEVANNIGIPSHNSIQYIASDEGICSAIRTTSQMIYSSFHEEEGTTDRPTLQTLNSKSKST
tara:strand:+ start:424 stop:873 length:450 start_codon:yes stop_codon:yes gene_type:complete